MGKNSLETAPRKGRERKEWGDQKGHSYQNSSSSMGGQISYSLPSHFFHAPERDCFTYLQHDFPYQSVVLPGKICRIKIDPLFTLDCQDDKNLHMKFLPFPLHLLFAACRRQQQHQQNLETRQSNTLFGVAGMFIIGHLLRISLNLHEMIVKANISEECKDTNPWPLWAYVSQLLPSLSLIQCFQYATSISHLLLVVSASANLFVYCAASKIFRKTLVRQVKRRFRKVTR